jgi:2-keto-3-deoxy-L-rhamnonate aldolase RhmA
MIDMEHSPLSAHQANDMVHATITASQGSCVPIIRVPSHGVEWIKWALDSGVTGIIIPMVNTKEEMDLIIKRACYPPLGQRSSGPFRTPFADLDEKTTSFAKYRSETVKDVAIMPMIESVEGVENAEEIMSADGVNGVFIGPVDLRSSMGFPGADGQEEQYVSAINKILGIGKRLEIPIGILGVEEELTRQIKIGFDFFLLGGDAAFMVLGAQRVLGKAHQSVEAAKLD